MPPDELCTAISQIMSTKRFIVAALASAIAFTGALSANADEYRGEKTLGVKVGYNTYNESPLAGIQFSYRFSKLLRLSPEVDYIFRDAGLDALTANVNMEFVFPLADNRCDIYPLVGINYSSWNFHDITANIDDVSTRISRFGLNAGAGVGINLSSSLRLSVSCAYTIIETFHGANISAGIHYRF